MRDLTVKTSNQLQETDFTPAQLELIKATVAKGATNDELKLFLYRCQHMGLDPLKPGMVHFIKYGSNPGTIVIGIDGFRSKAAKTGKHVGTRRGVVLDDKGKVVGAWCEIFRSDWQHPAREEVPMSEYNTGKGNWSKMPMTMIKKVAEVAALRMAFPDELGGIYSEEEMHQAAPKTRVIIEPQAEPIELEAEEGPSEFDRFVAEHDEPSPGDYVIPVGANKGKTLAQVGRRGIDNFLTWFDGETAAGKKMGPGAKAYAEAARAFLEVAE